MTAYYFGRGSSDCLRVEPLSGKRLRLSIGNAKTNEHSAHSVVIDDHEIFHLAQFCEALAGHLGISKLTDRTFDFSQGEEE